MDFAAFVLPDEVLQLQEQLPAAIEGAALGDPEGAYQAAEMTGQIVQILRPWAIGAGVLVSAYLILTSVKSARKNRKRLRGIKGQIIYTTTHPAFKAGVVAAAAAFLIYFFRVKKDADSWAVAASEMAALASQNQPSAADIEV